MDRSAEIRLGTAARFCAAAAMLVGAVAPARAQRDVIPVVKPGAGKAAIDISGVAVPPGDGGLAFARTLESDLNRWGWFNAVRSGGAALALKGTVSGQAGGWTARCALDNASAGRRLFDRQFDASPEPRRLAHEVADAIVQAVKGVAGVASTRIAMVCASGASKDIYVCDSDGANLARITSDGAVCLSPRWWPDASALAYTSFHHGYPDVYKLDLQARRRTRLANFAGINVGADISPDGRAMALALSKDGNPELYVMGLRDGSLTRLTRTAHAAEASPSWSPDGRQIAFVSDRTGKPHLYLTDSARGAEKRITFRGTENVAPDWGPDGRIAYSSRRGARYVICVYDPRTGDEAVVSPESTDGEDPSWAPDGRHLVYTRTERYRSELWVLDTMGDAPVRLISMSGDCYSAAWSPR